jgi:hypothetical protein
MAFHLEQQEFILAVEQEVSGKQGVEVEVVTLEEKQVELL